VSKKRSFLRLKLWRFTIYLRNLSSPHCSIATNITVIKHVPLQLSASVILPLGAKNNSFFPIKQPATCIQIILIFRPFFFFTISQGILKDDRPFFTSSTACHQGLCALIHTCIYKTSSILIIAFSWTADVFLRLSSFCYHDKFTVYLFAIFLFLQPHLIISFLIKCIASNNAHLLFSRLSLSLSLSLPNSNSSL